MTILAQPMELGLSPYQLCCHDCATAHVYVLTVSLARAGFQFPCGAAKAAANTVIMLVNTSQQIDGARNNFSLGYRA